MNLNAMEKVAWTELLVSVAAIGTVTLLIPWLGNGATGGFGVFGLLGLSVLFLRRRGNQVVVDERDLEIARKALTIGVGTAWMMLFMALVVATMWSGFQNRDSVSTMFLNWLIWVQFAVCYGVKGLAAVVMYRRQHAA